MNLTISVREFADELGMTLALLGKPDFEVSTSDLNRPGLQFTGYFVHFASSRVQLAGNAEMYYLNEMPAKEREKRMKDFFRYPDIPCVILARNHKPPPEMLLEAEAAGVTIFRSPLATTKISQRISSLLEKKLAPTITRHGVLLDVYGVGILLQGESGIGKSETALELIKRGHRLVADDVVEIRRVSDDRLVGTSPELTRHLMEIRGIGLIDVRRMYGVGAVIQEKSIDIVMQMEMWQDGKEYDRLGIDDVYAVILGVAVIKHEMPVHPGRNLAIIVEVAARNYRLKRLGYHTAREFDRRLADQMNGSIEK